MKKLLVTFQPTDEFNMIKKSIVDYLKLIFSDSDVVDIDLSRWDNCVIIYLVADHVGSKMPGKRAILALHFFGVRRFDWTFRHHGFKKYPLKSNKQTCLNWNIYRSKLVLGKISKLKLSGSEQFPTLKIDFEDIDIAYVDSSVLAAINPHWGTPGSGFVRPGIEQYSTLKKR